MLQNLKSGLIHSLLKNGQSPLKIKEKHRKVDKIQLARKDIENSTNLIACLSTLKRLTP